MGEGELRDEQADRARPEDQDPVPRRKCRGPDRPQGVPARLDECARDGIHRVGQWMQRCDRHCHLLGKRAGEATANADLVAVLADVLQPGKAAPAATAAEHGVAGRAATDPARVDVVADGGDGSAPLVSEPHRIGRVALVQIGHLTGEELDVGAAHTDALDVDDDLTLRGRRALDVLDLAASGPVTTKALMPAPSVSRCGSRE